MCLILISVCDRDSNIWGQVGQNFCRLHSTSMQPVQTLQKGLCWRPWSPASDPEKLK